MGELGFPNTAGTIVIGGGPAGLTAGWALSGRNQAVTILEADDQVGGIARTVVRDGYRFDLGGHRFYTKSAEVEAIWHDLLGPELLVRPRRSRIRWRGRFIDYPLRAGDVVRKIGPLELARSGSSYAAARLRPTKNAETFEQWVSARFGRRLYELFFRSYTEKVWGVPTSEIRAEWAAQRIRGLSLGKAVRASLFGEREPAHSLIEEFLYPRLGPGQMWEEMARRIEAAGGEVALGSPVSGIEINGGRVASVTARGEQVPAAGVISSLPLRTLVAIASPRPPDRVLEAAAGLRYRDFLTVALVIDGPGDPFPDNWIYVHDPDVRVGRIQNFRAWSPAMIPEAGRGCLGLEYFCFEGDETWSAPDERLVELATSELDRLGLCPRERVLGGHVARVPKAYPIYDSGYAERIATIRAWIESIEGLQQIGRNGLHRYNNCDHSMLTALRAVENLLDDAGHDLWAVNADGEYLEEGRRPQAEQPYRVAPETPAVRAPLADEALALQEIA